VDPGSTTFCGNGDYPHFWRNCYPHLSRLGPSGLPYTLSFLEPGTTYTFALTSTLNKVQVISQPLVIQTESASSRCSPGTVGQYCTPCGAGAFSSPDNSQCVSCPPGTFNLLGPSPASSSCTPCSFITFSSSTGQNSSCTPCPANSDCPLGSASPLASTLVAHPANSSTSSSSSSLSSLSLGYQYIIAFFALCLLCTVVCLIFHKWLRSGVAKMAGILRPPRWLLRVDDRKRLIEIPSFTRGLIGWYVFVGVVVVTVYQCNNFAVNQYGELSTLHPGTTFSDGTSTATATTSFPRLFPSLGQALPVIPTMLPQPVLSLPHYH